MDGGLRQAASACRGLRLPLSALPMSIFPKTARLMQRGAEFLGSETAILCGAMSWVSERNLVSAISNAGGFGVIACGAMTPDLLDAEIAATKALTGHSLGATGVQEAIYSLLMMNNGFICESAHIQELDPVFADMPIVRKRIDNVKIGTVLSNSFGFGGTNATLVFSRLDV